MNLIHFINYRQVMTHCCNEIFLAKKHLFKHSVILKVHDDGHSNIVECNIEHKSAGLCLQTNLHVVIF